MNAIELPFLYQTRTILRGISGATQALRTSRTRSRPHRHISTAPVIELTANTPESFLSQKAKETAISTRRKRKATITYTEKQVFKEIFNDIQAPSGQLTNAPGHETDPDAIYQLFAQDLNQRPRSVQEEYKTSEATSADWKEQIKRYPPSLRHAARSVGNQSTTSSGSSSSVPYISYEPNGQEYPISRTRDPRHGIYRPLQASPETAIQDDTNSTPALQLRDFNAQKSHELARGDFRGRTADYVEKQLKKISAELLSCVSSSESNSNTSRAGAFKMWEICQQKILPLVLELNPASSPPAEQQQQQESGNKEPTATQDITASAVQQTTAGEEKKGRSRSKTKSKKKQATEAATASLDSTPSPAPIPRFPRLAPDVSPFAVVTRLYPTLTLLALRLFTSKYPTTPFPLSLYAAIKTTSPQSRILGLNVHFYNTLLRHVWDVYSDLAALGDLLAEMQRMGVEPDGGTWEVFGRVEGERWVDLNVGAGAGASGEKGGGGSMRGKEWWGRPRQVQGWEGWLRWRDVVRDGLLARGEGHLLAEREYGAAAAGEGEGMRDVSGRGMWDDGGEEMRKTNVWL